MNFVLFKFDCFLYSYIYIFVRVHVCVYRRGDVGVCVGMFICLLVFVCMYILSLAFILAAFVLSFF